MSMVISRSGLTTFYNATKIQPPLSPPWPPQSGPPTCIKKPKRNVSSLNISESSLRPAPFLHHSGSKNLHSGWQWHRFGDARDQRGKQNHESSSDHKLPPASQPHDGEKGA